MPVFNLTIPDTSPLIVYNGTWVDSDHSDSAWVDYVNGTFHATEEYEASATLIFNGSAVYIFGARRGNHDLYTTTLDGTPTTGDGKSDTPIFNSSLFSATNLGGHQHHLVFQNTFRLSSAAPFVDIDYMVITSGDGNVQTQSADVWLDDGAHNITYSDGWDTSPNGLEASYYMNTMHRTNVNGASASLLFNGSAITVYGATSTDYGLFSVSLDGSDSPLLLNGSAPMFRPQNMLYYAGGLSDELHSLTFTNADPNGSWFDLDKFVVSTWQTSDDIAISSSSSSTSHLPGPSLLNPNQSPRPKVISSPNKTSAWMLVAIIVAAVIGSALFGLGTYVFIRRRHRRGLYRIRSGTTSPANGMVEPPAGTAERTPLHLSVVAASDLAVSGRNARQSSSVVASHFRSDTIITSLPAYSTITTSLPAYSMSRENRRQYIRPSNHEKEAVPLF